MATSKRYWYIIIRKTDYMMASLDHDMTQDDLKHLSNGYKYEVYGPWGRKPPEHTAQEYFDAAL